MNTTPGTVRLVPKQKAPLTDFGARLVALRRERALTQAQLADASGVSQRMISHYESTPGHPTAPVVAKLAAALGVSADELLGVGPRKKTTIELDSAEARRLWKKFHRLLELPEKDQRAVLRLLNSLAQARATHPRAGSKRAFADGAG